MNVLVSAEEEMQSGKKEQDILLDASDTARARERDTHTHTCMHTRKKGEVFFTEQRKDKMNVFRVVSSRLVSMQFPLLVSLFLHLLVPPIISQNHGVAFLSTWLTYLEN
jgi:hypothetical protein